MPQRQCPRGVILAARYGREGYAPTDPDLVLAREVVANHFKISRPDRAALEDFDDGISIQIALAAIRAARVPYD